MHFYCRKHINKTGLNLKKTTIFSTFLSDKGFKGTVVNRALRFPLNYAYSPLNFKKGFFSFQILKTLAGWAALTDSLGGLRPNNETLHKEDEEQEEQSKTV